MKENTKIQAPNTKKLPNSKHQSSLAVSVVFFWSLKFGVSLGFGLWCLVFFP